MISWFSYLCSCLLSSILVCIFIFGKIVLQTLIAKRAWKLSRMPFNWPPKGSLSFCPSSLSINPQHSSQRIPLKMSLRACLSCAKSLQWLRNKHQGLQDFTPTQPSLPLGCYFYISLLLPFFFFFGLSGLLEAPPQFQAQFALMPLDILVTLPGTLLFPGCAHYLLPFIIFQLKYNFINDIFSWFLFLNSKSSN